MWLYFFANLATLTRYQWFKFREFVSTTKHERLTRQREVFFILLIMVLCQYHVPLSDPFLWWRLQFWIFDPFANGNWLPIFLPQVNSEYTCIINLVISQFGLSSVRYQQQAKFCNILYLVLQNRKVYYILSQSPYSLIVIWYFIKLQIVMCIGTSLF